MICDAIAVDLPIGICIDVDDNSCDGCCVVGVVLAFNDGFDILFGNARGSSCENRLKIALDCADGDCVVSTDIIKILDTKLVWWFVVVCFCYITMHGFESNSVLDT